MRRTAEKLRKKGCNKTRKIQRNRRIRAKNEWRRKKSSEKAKNSKRQTSKRWLKITESESKTVWVGHSPKIKAHGKVAGFKNALRDEPKSEFSASQAVVDARTVADNCTKKWVASQRKDIRLHLQACIGIHWRKAYERCNVVKQLNEKEWIARNKINIEAQTSKNQWH